MYGSLHVRALVLASILYLTPPRRGKAEETVDFKVMHYQEENGRISVTSPAFLYQYDVSPTFGIRIDGVYNTISGASPTGAPPTPISQTVTTVVSTPGGGGTVSGQGGGEENEDEREGEEDDRLLHGFDYHTLAAASGGSSTSSSGSGSSGGGSQTVTTQVPTGEFELPVANVEDERWGLNIEVIKKLDEHALSAKVSFSTESDYESYAVALSDSLSLNDRNTVLTVGAAYTYDMIDVLATGAAETKTTTDVMLGVSQLLGPATRIQANLVVGYLDGYLNDPYKVVELNGILVPEARPSEKTKTIAYLSAIRYLAALKASIEAGYRYYSDDFGVSGQTVSLAWYQKMGEHFVLRPRARLYEQSAADFYAVRFTGAPTYYSADYRISELQSLSYGLKLIWHPVDRFAMDVGYDRYEQEGKDGVTSDLAYPNANVFTAGVRIWF